MVSPFRPDADEKGFVYLRKKGCKTCTKKYQTI